MSSDLEETFNCIYDVRVPPLWGKVCPLHTFQPGSCVTFLQFSTRTTILVL
jgi:hypothetical protein